MKHYALQAAVTALCAALTACSSAVTMQDASGPDACDATPIDAVTARDVAAIDTPAIDVSLSIDTAAIDTAAIDTPVPDAPPPTDAPATDAPSEGSVTPFDAGSIPTPPAGSTTCGGALCSPGQQCCFTTGACFDPADAAACATPSRSTDPLACASNAQCAAGQFCDVMTGAPATCSGVGTCAPPLTGCGGFGDGVCGCDGRTYPDPCAASRAGVRVAVEDPCGTLAYPNAHFTQKCVAGGMDCDRLFESHCDTTLGHCVADHPIIACGYTAQCPAGQTCCGITGLCVDPSVPELCQTPPAGSHFPCRVDLDCAPFDEAYMTGSPVLYCGGPGCGPGGGCFRPPGSCTGVLAPVCGCDGMTYTNACSAAQVRVRVAHTGTCP